MARAVDEALDEVTLDGAAAWKYRLRLLGEMPLHERAAPVAPALGIAPGLVTALLREMHRFNGLGMAAQQVGGVQAVCVVRLSRKKGCDGPRKDVVLVNPRIVAKSPDTRIMAAEGCLSVPGFRTNVRRHQWVEVRYETPLFEEKQERLCDMDAQIVQHALDHLVGICIADGVSRQQRREAERLVAKARART